MPRSKRSDDLNLWSFIDLARTRLHEEFATCDVEATEILLGLNRVSTLITYDLESQIHRPEKRSWATYRLMYALWIAEKLESKKLAELTGMSRAAVSNLTGPMMDQGLVRKSTHPDDARSILLELTEEGLQATRGAYHLQNAREQQWVEALTEDERKELLRMLYKIADSRFTFDFHERP